jgi:hypothetical protein
MQCLIHLCFCLGTLRQAHIELQCVRVYVIYNYLYSIRIHISIDLTYDTLSTNLRDLKSGIPYS